MKLVVGKKYKNGRGDTVVITNEREHEFPFVGNNITHGYSESFKPNGQYYANDQSRYDLIAEIVEQLSLKELIAQVEELSGKRVILV